MAVRSIRSYAVTCLMLLVMGLFSFASWRTEMQQHDQDLMATRQASALTEIATNTARLQTLVNADCQAQNRNAASLNSVLDAVIAGVHSGKYTPVEREIRIARYEAAKVALVRCEVTP